MTLLDADVRQDPLLGEDTWELFEAIEESFAVDLDDYHAICGITIRELAGFIYKKANYPIEEKCLSAVAFYRLRQAFITLFGIPRDAIRPGTPVRDLLPWKSRAGQWLMLQDHLDLKFPRLNLPTWDLILPLVVCPALIVSIEKLLRIRISMGWIVAGSAALILFTFARVFPAIDRSFPLAQVLPKGCETFGGLVKTVLARNYGEFALQQGGSDEEGVVEALRHLTALQVGLDLEQVTSGARIPQDLDIYQRNSIECLAL